MYSLGLAIRNWTGGFYSLLFQYRYYFAIFLAFIFFLIIFRSIKNYISSKKYSKMEFGTTNTWFEWSKYEEYIEKNKNK